MPMPQSNTPQDKYAKASTERQKHVDAVLASKSRKKVVVAGPGTGKTYLFKELIRDKSKTLTLSFINALVDDLALELCGMSDVRTLHGFAVSELHRFGRSGILIFPGFSEVVKEDWAFLNNEHVDFAQLLHDDVTDGPHIQFYRERRSYYGDVYGMDSIVYALVQAYRKQPERIPVYEQVVVDEFQDFNLLEVALIELLASKSPVLLAGDDDQALYDFKSASAAFIRDRHSKSENGYEPFSLPYCSRCTRVVVGAANDIIEAATTNGNLVGRLGKRYDYFDHEEKDAVSDQHPDIVYKQVFDSQLPWYIADQLGKIAEVERKVFDVLIISPTKDQARRVVEGLKDKGLKNVSLEKRQDAEQSDFQSGLRTLLRNKDSNLGWRLAARGLLAEGAFAKVLQKSLANKDICFSAHLETSTRKQVREALAVARAVAKKKTAKKERVAALASLLGLDNYEMATEAIREQVAELTVGGGAAAAIRRIPVRSTTVQGSKGLSADYVFITHFDDFWFINDKDKTKISDKDVCSFLVALTRAKTKLFLMSAKNVDPTFVKWIKPERLDRS